MNQIPPTLRQLAPTIAFGLIVVIIATTMLIRRCSSSTDERAGSGGQAEAEIDHTPATAVAFWGAPSLERGFLPDAFADMTWHERLAVESFSGRVEVGAEVDRLVEAWIGQREAQRARAEAAADVVFAQLQERAGTRRRIQALPTTDLELLDLIVEASATQANKVSSACKAANRTSDAMNERLQAYAERVVSAAAREVNAGRASAGMTPIDTNELTSHVRDRNLAAAAQLLRLDPNETPGLNGGEVLEAIRNNYGGARLDPTRGDGFRPSVPSTANTCERAQSDFNAIASRTIAPISRDIVSRGSNLARQQELLRELAPGVLNEYSAAIERAFVAEVCAQYLPNRRCNLTDRAQAIAFAKEYMFLEVQLFTLAALHAYAEAEHPRR